MKKLFLNLETKYVQYQGLVYEAFNSTYIRSNNWCQMNTETSTFLSI